MGKESENSDWLFKLRNRNDLPSSTHDENVLIVNAINGLRIGDLRPLATAIKNGALRISPNLAALLVGMIEHDQNSEFLINVVPNPKKISRKNQSHMANLQRDKRTREIGYFLVKKGVHESVDSSVYAAEKHFKLGKSTVYAEWKNFQTIYKTKYTLRKWQAKITGGDSTFYFLKFLSENPHFDISMLYNVPSDFTDSIADYEIQKAMKADALI